MDWSAQKRSAQFCLGPISASGPAVKRLDSRAGHMAVPERFADMLDSSCTAGGRGQCHPRRRTRLHRPAPSPFRTSRVGCDSHRGDRHRIGKATRTPQACVLCSSLAADRRSRNGCRRQNPLCFLSRKAVSTSGSRVGRVGFAIRLTYPSLLDTLSPLPVKRVVG